MNAATPPAPAKDASRPGVQHLTIDDSHAGQRLDNFLLGFLKGVPRTHIYRLMRKGEVRLNKGRCHPDDRLKVGDIVRIPPVRLGSRPASDLGAAIETGRFDWLNDRALYEDEQLLIIDKPAGLAVHGGSGVSVGLIEALRGLRPHTPFLELVHRLDRDTSGCLLLAKSRAALLKLHASLRDGGMDKHYLALVAGAWRGGVRQVEAALEKGRLAGGERHVQVGAAGKESSSDFTPREKFAQATLVEIHLHTGRTHQARVHAVHIGHPIGGDDKYGDRAFNQSLKQHGLDRLFLHAARVHYRHPLTERKMQVEAPLPAELMRVLNSLRAESDTSPKP